MTKYYKVLKDNCLWEVGAILDNKDGGYKPIDNTELWNKTKSHSEYLTEMVVEHSPDYFVQVYPISLLTKTIYKIKEEAIAMMAKEYNE